jgi:hypothetical protein
VLVQQLFGIYNYDCSALQETTVHPRFSCLKVQQRAVLADAILLNSVACGAYQSQGCRPCPLAAWTCSGIRVTQTFPYVRFDIQFLAHNDVDAFLWGIRVTQPAFLHREAETLLHWGTARPSMELLRF